MGLPSDEIILKDCANCPDFVVRVLRDLEEENAHLERQVKFLAGELADRSYAFTAEDWLDIAERETRNGRSMHD